MNDTLSPLERRLTAQIDGMLSLQRDRIRTLETQVAMLMEERTQMRSMLDFVERLGAAEGFSQP